MLFVALLAPLLFAADPIPTPTKIVDGYQSETWGMNADEVRKVVPDLKPAGQHHFTSEASIAGFPVTLHHFFLGEKLALVRIVFKDSSRAQYDRLRALLIEKYGATTIDKVDFDDSIVGLVKHSIWRGESSEIRIDLIAFAGSKSEPTTSIAYQQSSTVAELDKQTKADAAAARDEIKKSL